jgi:hypothetical protein
MTWPFTIESSKLTDFRGRQVVRWVIKGEILLVGHTND